MLEGDLAVCLSSRPAGIREGGRDSDYPLPMADPLSSIHLPTCLVVQHCQPPTTQQHYYLMHPLEMPAPAAKVTSVATCNSSRSVPAASTHMFAQGASQSQLRPSCDLSDGREMAKSVG